jgi:hypothetical protein
MTISPLIAAFFATQPARREPAAVAPVEDQRTASLDNDPLWRATACEIPRMKIPGESVGLLHIGLMEQGTVFCPWCDDGPDGCKCAATAERWAAYRARLEQIKRNNDRATRENREYSPRRSEEAVAMMRRTIG